jgi:hypothetical protein
MKITICGSVVFSNEMIKAAEALKEQGHEVELPYYTKKILNGEVSLEDYKKTKSEKGDVGYREAASEDLIKRYFRLIGESDAILVLNLDKNGVKNYIGGSSFFEMSFAYVLDKKIFLFNDIPDMQYTDELKSMSPIIINGELSKIN